MDRVQSLLYFVSCCEVQVQLIPFILKETCVYWLNVGQELYDGVRLNGHMIYKQPGYNSMRRIT